jgi:hypothetical protein
MVPDPTPLPAAARGVMIGCVLGRLFYHRDGRVRTAGVVSVGAVSVLLATVGTVLIVVTPHFSGGWARTLWVLFVVVALKLPLVVMLWYFIAKNREWPGKPVVWDAKERSDILAYLQAEADRALHLPDAEARLAYLSREAWNVADRVDDHAKVDALTVALRIDMMAATRRERRSAP